MMDSSYGRLKILLVTPLPPPAGGITSWTEHYLASEEAKENSIAVVNCAVTGNRVQRPMERRFKDELLRAIRIKKEISNLLKSEKFDVVHYNSSCSLMGMVKDYLCLRQAKGMAKIIVQYHCDTANMVHGRLSEFMFKGLSRLADEILCLNDHSKQHIQRIAKRKSVVIPNFISLKPEYQKKSLSDEIKTIVYVGHVLVSKGYVEIIKVAKKYPDINFKIIGARRADYEYTDYPNVEYLGEVSKEVVFSHLQTADLFLFPSHSEGFPMAVLEAMTCGLPIIATKVGAIPDMIEDKGGILIDIDDPEGIVKAIDDLQGIAVRRKMSAWNIEKVRNCYTVEIVMKKIFQIYRNQNKSRSYET